MLDHFENLTVWKRVCVVLSKALFTVKMDWPLVLKMACFFGPIVFR